MVGWWKGRGGGVIGRRDGAHIALFKRYDATFSGNFPAISADQMPGSVCFSVLFVCFCHPLFLNVKTRNLSARQLTGISCHNCIVVVDYVSKFAVSVTVDM